VKTNPTTGPAKLRMGSSTLESVTKLDDAFFNQDRLGKTRRKMLAEGLRPQGIRRSKDTSTQRNFGSHLQATEDMSSCGRVQRAVSHF